MLDAQFGPVGNPPVALISGSRRQTHHTGWLLKLIYKIPVYRLHWFKVFPATHKGKDSHKSFIFLRLFPRYLSVKKYVI
jgi:hypothetical protein